jgi:hypothetical protein
VHRLFVFTRSISSSLNQHSSNEFAPCVIAVRTDSFSSANTASSRLVDVAATNFRCYRLSIKEDVVEKVRRGEEGYGRCLFVDLRPQFT